MATPRREELDKPDACGLARRRLRLVLEGGWAGAREAASAPDRKTAGASARAGAPRRARCSAAVARCAARRSSDPRVREDAAHRPSARARPRHAPPPAARRRAAAPGGGRATQQRESSPFGEGAGATFAFCRYSFQKPRRSLRRGGGAGACGRRRSRSQSRRHVADADAARPREQLCAGRQHRERGDDQLHVPRQPGDQAVPGRQLRGWRKRVRQVGHPDGAVCGAGARPGLSARRAPRARRSAAASDPSRHL